MEKQWIKIEGTVESVTFRNEDSGFTVLQLDYKNELLTVVGEMLGVEAGEKLQLHGSYASHPTYGTQFKVQAYERTLPSNANAILKYLSSGAVKGIGPVLATRLVETFGDETLQILEKDPARLREVKGITAKKAADIGEQYGKLFGIRSMMMYLSRFHIPATTTINIWKKWGASAKNVIEENPHILCAEDFGLTFEDCDAIATAQNLQIDQKKRLKAAVAYVLRGNTFNGHTCLPFDKLTQVVLALTEEGINLLEEAVEEEVLEENLRECMVKGRRYIYLPNLYEAEEYIASRLQFMLMLNVAPQKDYSKEIARLQEQNGLHYAKKQKQAINEALCNNLFILTGGPGTGKTTTTNAIISLLEQQGSKVALTAPTGRAAQRMAQVTGKEAKTLHRLLEVDFTEKNTLKFRRNMNNPLPYDGIIVDEVSMVDVMLMQSLIKALKMGARLILVGDADQLPSVGPGNVLGDLLKSEAIPRVELTEIFRQAAESLIVTNAHAIVEGKMPVLDCTDKDFFFMNRRSNEAMLQTVTDLCKTRLPKTYGYSTLWDIQVIAPTRVGEVGTTRLNQALQAALNPPEEGKTQVVLEGRTFRKGDKVMQTKNNYDLPWTDAQGEAGIGVYNGDIGVIRMLDKASKTILVDYEDRLAEYTFEFADQLEHAYAITVHKSQGSEFEAVVMPIMSFGSKMQYRNLLYTAVTRARSNLILLGSPTTVQRMVENNRRTIRYTNLLEFVLGEVETNGQELFDTPERKES